MFWTPRLCRICASIGAVTYPIFSNASSRDIEAKFKKCFQINVCSEDFKPKEVCSDCIVKLDEYCMFLELFVASNNKFESILYQTNRSELQDNWQNRIDYKLGTDLFSAPTESGVIVKPEDIVLASQYKGDVLNIDIQDRDVISESTINMTEALETFEQTQNQTVLRHSSEFYKTNVELDCNLDEFNFNYQKKKSFTTEFTTYSDTYTEKVISYRETNDKVETVDVAKAEKKKPFACSECDKSFMRKLSLKAHMSTHTNVKPYRCDVCLKSFPLRWVLTGHKKIHTDLHRCEYCSKSFAVASKLVRHVRTHTKDKPFTCEADGCGKSFSDKRNLVGHQSSHTKDRNFACELCKKRYKTKGRLRDHQKAHTDISFACHICAKSFKWRTNLLAHIKKHSDFHCTKCKIDFRNRSMYLMHREECPSLRVVTEKDRVSY